MIRALMRSSFECPTADKGGAVVNLTPLAYTLALEIHEVFFLGVTSSRQYYFARFDLLTPGVMEPVAPMTVKMIRCQGFALREEWIAEVLDDMEVKLLSAHAMRDYDHYFESSQWIKEVLGAEKDELESAKRRKEYKKIEQEVMGYCVQRALHSLEKKRREASGFWKRLFWWVGEA